MDFASRAIKIQIYRISYSRLQKHLPLLVQGEMHKYTAHLKNLLTIIFGF